jgi:uracil-DNA glycosylase
MERMTLAESWKTHLQPEFQRAYMQDLNAFLRAETQKGKEIYPAGPEIFNALNSTPLDKVKLVILGQDPYHGPGQAHGLCFSVQQGVALPPSLRNIYKEIMSDLNIPMSKSGYLQPWADQGVLLLNSVLTVEAGQAASHQRKGWETFTDRIVQILNEERENLVFLLWGNYAHKKGQIIDRTRHLVLESVHPSPLSASRGFFGNHQFSKANAYLQAHGLDPIDWRIQG